MRRGAILIILGLVLATGTAGAVFFLLQSAGQQTVPEIERAQVVVAIQPIAEDETIEGRLDLQLVPVEAIPPNALRSLEGTGVMIAAGPIPQGTIIQPEMLQTPEEMMQEGQVSQLVEEGFLAVSFPIDELSSVSYGILPGDHVDMLITFPFIDLDLETQMEEPICPPLCPSAGDSAGVAQVSGQVQRLVSQVTLQDVPVLGVGRWDYKPAVPEGGTAVQGGDTAADAAAEPPQYITLMLTPQNALVAKLARDYDASVQLAIRSQDDHTLFTNIEAVTLDWIMAHFGVPVPEQRDYTIRSLPPR
ncbi:MAG: Flp pilus assembly protein CpaB [Anaerolineae bacterium]|nr:Flp pilus assembly protein CpaB [Anaerolineae bacterium]